MSSMVSTSRPRFQVTFEYGSQKACQKFFYTDVCNLINTVLNPPNTLDIQRYGVLEGKRSVFSYVPFLVLGRLLLRLY